MSEHAVTFTSLSQRAAHTYLRSLAAAPEDLNDSQRDLRAFFAAFYQALFDDPARFGLPIEPDDCITGAEENRTKKLAVLNRKLQRPRDQIAAGLQWLMQVAQQGHLTIEGLAGAGQGLSLDEAAYAELVTRSAVRKPFLAGLATLGLEAQPSGGSVIVRSGAYPAMLPALQQLAHACQQIKDARLAGNSFARCEFQALDPRYAPSALDLYRVFGAEEYPRLARLHAYYTERGYQAMVEIHDIHAWIVKYQGSRKVKATPLAEVQYHERYLEPLRVAIKCASAARIAPLVAQQPHSVQADFYNRTILCGDCGWCRNKKTLGPTQIAFEGQEKRACWFIPGEIQIFNDDAITLMQHYTALHESLVE